MIIIWRIAKTLDNLIIYNYFIDILHYITYMVFYENVALLYDDYDVYV